MNATRTSDSSFPVLAQVVVPVVQAVIVPPAIVTAEALFVAESVSDPVLAQPVQRVGLFRRLWRGIASACEWLFGALSLMVGLAFLAAVPLVQFLTLGYLLEAAGRVARTGRLRDGFIGVRTAARVGSVVLGVWLMLLPLRYVSSLASSAQILDPGGRGATRWGLWLTMLTVAMTIHILLACARGGRLRHFFWPFTNPLWLARQLGRGDYYVRSRDAVWDFVAGMRLPYYFWLGLRGFVGAFVWLLVPVTLLAAGTLVPNIGPILGVFGAFQLIVVLWFLPFLQVRFAAENRFRALFEFVRVAVDFCRAPWAFAFALLVTLLFALPLYLLKIEMVPREAAWLPSLVFIVFMFPARLLTGWAYSRAQRRATARHWLFGVTGGLLTVPAIVFYVFILFFTQYTAWAGVGSLYEQHAFLLPVPFMGR